MASTALPTGAPTAPCRLAHADGDGQLEAKLTTQASSSSTGSEGEPPKRRLSRKATPYVAPRATDGGAPSAIAGDADLGAHAARRGLAARRSSSEGRAGADNAAVPATRLGASPAERRRADQLAKSAPHAIPDAAKSGVSTPPRTPPLKPKAGKEDAGAALPECRTTAMRGDGFYNRYCELQREAVRSGLPAFERACAALPRELVDGRAVRVADFGSSQGLNSVLPMRIVVSALAARAESLDVVHQVSAARTTTRPVARTNALRTSPPGECGPHDDAPRRED